MMEAATGSSTKKRGVANKVGEKEKPRHKDKKEEMKNPRFRQRQQHQQQHQRKRMTVQEEDGASKPSTNHTTGHRFLDSSRVWGEIEHEMRR